MPGFCLRYHSPVMMQAKIIWAQDPIPDSQFLWSLINLQKMSDTAATQEEEHDVIQQGKSLNIL